MFYVIRRKSDDFYFVKGNKWVKHLGKDSWLTKEQVTQFKKVNESILDFFLFYTILNPCDGSSS